MKKHEIIALCEKYGEKITLGELRNYICGDTAYMCPKCHGTGSVTVEYNGYPQNLPDSCGVYEPAYRTEDCDLCKGEGYTSRPMRPRMVQDGWEEGV